MRLRFVKKMFWVILQNLQETTGPLILGGRGTMCSITHVDVSLFHFDNDSTWKVLLVKIFPVFDFSTSFKPSRSFNGLKWKCSWGFIPDLALWIYRGPYSLTRFSFREKYKCPLWTLLLQSLRPFDSTEPSALESLFW